MLALFARGGPSSVRVAEGLVEYPLARREAASVTEYVAANVGTNAVMVDARWQAQTQFDAAMSLNNNSAAQSALEELQSMLEGMGLNVKLPQLPDQSAILAAQFAAMQALPAGKTADTTLTPEFAAGNGEQKFKLGDHVYTVSIAPLAARPCLNYLSARALRDYLVYLGLDKDGAERMSDVIASWRGDADAHDVGATQWYLAQPEPYGERGERIKSWSEVSFLRQMNPDDVEFLRRHFALTGRDGRVDPNYFDANAIAALADITPDEAEKALEWEAAPVDPNVGRRPLEDIISSDAADKFRQAVTVAVDPNAATGAGFTTTQQAPPVIATIGFRNDTRVYVINPSERTVIETLHGDIVRLSHAAPGAQPAAPAPAAPETPAAQEPSNG